MNAPPTPDAPHAQPNRLVQAFDVSFVMILCFLTLLGTMLLNGTVLVGGDAGDGLDHSFHAPTFLLVAVLFVLYLGYLLRHSERGLREIVHHVYGPPTPATPRKDTAIHEPVETAERSRVGAVGLPAPRDVVGLHQG